MITSKKELKRVLEIESNSYQLSISQRILGLFGLSERGIIWNYQNRLRKYEYHLNCNHRVRSTIYHFLVNRLSFRYGMAIEPNAVDEGMHICHVGKILIRGKVGKYSTIHIHVSLVGGGACDIAPVCGDNVYFGIGSTIVGGIKVGSNVCIGAGAVVTSDVESNRTVAGVPAKIINRRGPLDWH